MAGVTAVATLVQAASDQVEPQQQTPTMQVRIDTDIGRLEIDGRPLAPGRAHRIDDAILDALRPEAGMTDMLGLTVKIHGQTAPGAQVSAPVHPSRRLDQGLGTFDALLAQKT